MSDVFVPWIHSILPRSILWIDYRGRLHWTINGVTEGPHRPSERCFSFITKKVARAYFLGKVGDNWHEVMRAARLGKPLTYQGPMDRYPTSLFNDPSGKCKYSYRVQGDRLRITPPEGGDPFWADYKHSERMKVKI